MRYFLLIILFFIIQNCSKPKIVYICGDHICVNKSEAEQYFEENLSLEVKIVNKKDNEDFDLVKLNLKDNSLDNKQIIIEQEVQTTKKIKNLKDDQIKEIKKVVKKKDKEKKVVKKTINNKVKKKEILSQNNSKIAKKNNIQKTTININNKRKEIVDICTIIENCSIDEISKYLLDMGFNKDFPDITRK